MTARIALTSAAALMTVSTASAQQVEIPIDMSLSDVVVGLTISGASDTDTSPLTGMIVVNVEDFSNPTQFSIVDLQLEATETINHNISFGILGGFTQSSDGVSVSYALPGTPTPPVPLAGTMFTIPMLETTLGGTGTYNATGLVCTLLEGQMLPCSDTLDFGTGGVIAAENIDGTLEIAGDAIGITLNLTLSVPFDPNDPGLGMITVNGFAAGVGTLPPQVCFGDCDGSGTVDFNDLVTMLFEFGNSDYGACDADLSGTVDFNDLVSALFLFGPCP